MSHRGVEWRSSHFGINAMTTPPSLRSDPIAPASGAHELAPERVWQRAVVEFAQRHQLPEEHVLAGAGFVCADVTFQIHYNVETDPQGLVLMMDMGEIPAETAHHVHLEMLANNARGAAPLLGYQGIFPGIRRGAHCVRLDLARCPDPSVAISAAAAALSLSVHKARDSMQGMLRDVAEMVADA